VAVGMAERSSKMPTMRLSDLVPTTPRFMYVSNKKETISDEIFEAMMNDEENEDMQDRKIGAVDHDNVLHFKVPVRPHDSGKEKTGKGLRYNARARVATARGAAASPLAHARRRARAAPHAATRGACGRGELGRRGRQLGSCARPHEVDAAHARTDAPMARAHRCRLEHCTHLGRVAERCVVTHSVSLRTIDDMSGRKSSDEPRPNKGRTPTKRIPDALARYVRRVG
jgi:hypothetical protein